MLYLKLTSTKKDLIVEIPDEFSGKVTSALPTLGRVHSPIRPFCFETRASVGGLAAKAVVQFDDNKFLNSRGYVYQIKVHVYVPSKQCAAVYQVFKNKVRLVDTAPENRIMYLITRAS